MCIHLTRKKTAYRRFSLGPAGSCLGFTQPVCFSIACLSPRDPVCHQGLSFSHQGLPFSHQGLPSSHQGLPFSNCFIRINCVITINCFIRINCFITIKSVNGITKCNRITESVTDSLTDNLTFYFRYLTSLFSAFLLHTETLVVFFVGSIIEQMKWRILYLFMN